MGCYINPPNESKESWLASHAVEVQPLAYVDGGKDYLVCLVDNGPFTAAGVAYSAREFEEFMQPDERPRRWFLAAREDLLQVSPLERYEQLRDRKD